MSNIKLPKLLGVYLPQFHETEDNNLWWGEGFTDWNSVKQSEPLFDGHNAPWIPLDENYYDLSKYESIKWQANIAKKYGLDGFCFYHYYFKGGKKELEKPAELLLEHKDIDIPFCFNWASESWIRSWSKIAGNVWSEKYEGKSENQTDGILVEQDYGGKQEWVEHFDYLLPFFKDKRYICVDGKPVFIFYRPGDIECLKEMIACWRMLAKEAGFSDMYLVGANTNASLIGLDASIIYEPRTAINRMNSKGEAISKAGVRCFDYADAWNAVLEDKPYAGTKTYFTAISGYDDTPRRGKSGEVLINNTPEIFEKYLKKIIIKSIKNENEFLFINAWNEWGEGMYLEPDTMNKYGYLEALKRAKSDVEANLSNYDLSTKIEEDSSEKEEKLALIYEVNKYKTFLNYYDKWLYLLRDNKFDIDEYLQKQGISTVAIYGLGMLGKQLINQLQQSSISVKYGVDRYVGQYGCDFTIIRPENEEWPYVDAVIITAYDEDDVANFVTNKINTRIMKMSKLIEDLWKKE